MQFLIVMVLVLAVMYVLMIRPQRQRQAQHQSTLETAGVGDDVLTTGGIYGTIVEAEGDEIVVEIAPAVNVHMTRRGIATVLPPEEQGEEEQEEEHELERVAIATDENPDGDEGAVREGEEPVRSDGADTSSGDDRR